MITNVSNIEEVTSEEGVGVATDTIYALQTNASLNDAYHVRRGNGGLKYSKGVLAGKQWQPRQIAELADAHGFTATMDMATAIAICFAECQGRDHSYNDNLRSDGSVWQRDCGLMQIGIDASLIGTKAEEDLYDPDTNMSRAFGLWQNRGWQPWASFTTGVYLHKYYTGRSALGMMNYTVERFNALGATLPLPVFTLADAREKIQW